MTVTITDYVRVSDRIAALGCNPISGLAILPENFEAAATRADLKVRAEAATVRTLLRNEGLPIQELLPDGERYPSIHNKSFDWAAIVFVSGAMLSNDAVAVNLALSVIANYATEFFRGRPGKSVRLSIVVERTSDRVCKNITYEGDAAGLASLPKIIREVGDGKAE